MPPKRNPLGLNKLQLRTLALLQELARHPETARALGDAGDVAITGLPHVHGDHVHIGSFVVSARDASGLSNPAVYAALERKGLVRPGAPGEVALTAAGVAYDTGLGQAERRPSDH